MNPSTHQHNLYDQIMDLSNHIYQQIEKRELEHLGDLESQRMNLLSAYFCSPQVNRKEAEKLLSISQKMTCTLMKFRQQVQDKRLKLKKSRQATEAYLAKY